ncbi:MAG: IPT/TIG domain-containing protein [Treponema sp.]|jgi:transglutaminase-like putative cysteine protease|nr:IPT/TIG domain-containing protein [Treponema sp.]
MKGRLRGFKYYLPRLKKRISLFLLLLPAILLSCEKKIPVIHSLDPSIGMLGEQLNILGECFGDERGESYVSIAGIAPTGSSYVRWEDTRITLRLPEFGDSGLVRVHVGDKRSNALLFSNRITMPAPVEGEDFGIGPQIGAVEPGSAPIGALVSITGSGFGSSREQSGVFFSWDAEAVPGTPADNRSPGFIGAFEGDHGYDLWTDREIRVRVPDGAVSGNVEIRTPRGVSRPVFFEVSGKPGTKTFRNKRSYTFSYPVQIRIQDASGPNTLYLWVPRPAVSASQRNPELLSRGIESFVEDYRGTNLFRLEDLAAGSTVSLDQVWLVEVYAQETNLRYQQIRQDTSSPIYAANTQATALIPADDGRITALGGQIYGRERNPYLKARQIYEWLVNGGNISGGRAEAGGVLEALEQGRFDSYTASLLFCALARSGGVPALPVSGVLIGRGQTAKHYWAEFWIDGFGWVPLDPALGAGAAPGDFELREDAKSWYFGNLDNQRIAFSRGQNPLSPMDPRGRTVVRDRELQNLWEEAVGGLRSYSSLWGDVTITGVYAR